MNYRHAFHAGNFVDVMKHAVLALVIEYLKKKDKPFCMIDTHAGIGCYDLESDEARRSGEAKDGIGRLLAARSEMAEDLSKLLAPYIQAVSACNPNGGNRWYPGSPKVARVLMRACDRLLVNELHPHDNADLRLHFARDRQTAVLAQNGWQVLKSSLPPKERRGVILVDPPFEQPGEFQRLVEGLSEATRRFATGIYLLWYPIKNDRAVSAFTSSVMGLGLSRLVKAEMYVRAPGPGRHRASALYGSGLLIHNAPYGLIPALEVVLPALANILAPHRNGGACLTELCGETTGASAGKA